MVSSRPASWRGTARCRSQASFSLVTDNIRQRMHRRKNKCENYLIFFAEGVETFVNKIKNIFFPLFFWTQKVAYRSKRCVYDLRTIAEVEGAPVKAWKHAVWDEQILVPALPQSILQGCNLIQIDYYLQVRHSPCYGATKPPVFLWCLQCSG